METIKMTRALLDSYRKLLREINLLEKELEDMLRGDHGIGSSVVMDYRKGYPQPQGVTGFDGELYDRRRKILEGKRKKCKAIENWINAIEDTTTRCVFKMYYIDGLTWEKIVMKIGYTGNPDYPRLVIRDRYLKKMQIK